MKRIICSLLLILLCISPTQKVKAEETFSVNEVAVQLLTSAMNNWEAIGLPDVQGESLYICNSINPYCFDGNELTVSSDVEYYLIKTMEEYIACITLCYENGAVISATLDTGIAEVLNTYDIVNEDFALIVNGGILYLKTEESVVPGNYSTAGMARTVSEVDNTAYLLNKKECETYNLVVEEELQMPMARSVMPRSSKILTVPYVSQGDYDLCWAAAASALGQYYTGDTYAYLTPYDLASIVGVGNQGASMSKAQQILSDVFHISTRYKSGQMSASEIVGHINVARPLLVGFYRCDTIASQEIATGHMVVVCGFDDSSSSGMQYYVRDSNFSSLKIVYDLSGDGTVVMDGYSIFGPLYWNETAYKK